MGIHISLQSTLMHLMVLLFVFMTLSLGADAIQCTRKNFPGSDETFDCPRLFESRKKRFCCGTYETRYCCEWSDAKDQGTSFTNISQKSQVQATVLVIFFILLIFGGLIACCCCCICCLLSKRRQSPGQVLSTRNADGTTTLGGTSVTSVNPYPIQSNAYPMQQVAQSYPSYPAYPGQQPTYGGDNPPPYPTQPPFNPEYPMK